MSTTPSTTRYDRFGRRVGCINSMIAQPDTYLLAQASETTKYLCYYETGSGPRAIWRIVKVSGMTQICVGWGAWADRETIAYYPINSIFVVEDETQALVRVEPYNTPVEPIAAA